MTVHVLSRYEILERLGGAFGTVHKARDLELERLVALRIVPARRFGTPEDRARLARAASILATLDHPNAGAIYETGETPEGDLFIATAFCDGESLARRLARGTIRPAAAVELAAQIAAGLGRAHERGLVHRNLRPSNVFVAADGQVKIVDFGLPSTGEQTLFGEAETSPDAPVYASPEQLRGEWVDARTDLWSLGSILAEMVTGRPLAPAVLPGAWEMPDTPEGIARVVSRAMAPHPADRYASAEEMRQDLRTLATGSLRTAASSPSSTPATGLAVTSVQARTVGPYRILERLGGGGMGIVYRAEDTRLGRLVALKFLPPELTRDPVAKARFQQEARAASALDHTNICTIYEVGETADEQLYLAMPCYDGETLRRRMERGPLPIEEAADIACQVARGLAKAHRQGIVHRDIKPANLILTTDGVVKILDFGIAKLAGEVGLTRTGSVVGTPAYMSPEQMRGEEVDARTDLWSLGVVLYEMLAGRRPFPGEHESVVRQAILGQQPEPISRVRPEVPAELARLVDGLLAKQPAARTGSAEEAAAELRVISGQTSGVLTAAGAVAARRGGSRWAVAALAVAAVVSLGLGLFLAVRARSGGAPVAATFTRLTDQEGRESFPSLSPDGGLLVYAASAGGATHIFLQRVGGDNPIDLTAGSPADDTQPAFSPDGARIAFRSERDGGGIFLMGATGGPVRRLTDFGFNPAWSPDGREILCASEGISDPVLRHTVSGLWRVDVATGVRRPVATGDAVQPSWSPHGRRIAYWGRSHEGAQRIVWTARPDGSGAVAAVRDGFLNWNPVWSPDGARLYFASDRGGSMNLWRVEIDEESGAVRGAPEPIVTPSPWSGLISLSREGHRLAFAINESKANIERAGFDPVRGAAGALTPVTQGSRAVRSAAPSPDGKWIAFHTSAPQEDLFVVRADGGGLRRLTDDAARDRFPRWSPDGSRLLFYSDRSGKYEAWSIRPDGGGLEQLTQVRGEPVFDPFWAPDGGRLGASLGFSGPVVIDLAGGIGRRQPLRVPMPSPETFSANDWSSDGDQLVAFDRNDELETYSFRTQTVRKLGAQGRTPFWLPDGRHVVFLREGVVRLLDTRTGEERPVLTPPPASRFIYVRPAADGRGLILVRAAEEGDIGMVTLP